MKNTSFKRLWTKTSLKRIRKEFVLHYSGFICNASLEFSDLWNSGHRVEIIRLAKEFVIPMGDDGVGADGLLFGDSYRRRRKEIRLEFLDHEIKRLSER